MVKYRKGIVILPILIIVVLLGIVGYLVYRDSQQRTTSPPPISIPTGSQITWDEARKLLEDCQVTEVFQTHNLEVTMTLKNGSTKTTTEPKIDEVLFLAKTAGQECGYDITRGTE